MVGFARLETPLCVCLRWAFTAVFAFAAEQPNILFFLADDQRHDTLGCAGHPIVQTPMIDRLAVNRVRFKYARYLDQDPVYEFLHDLVSDPDERVNLIADPQYGSIRKRLRRRTDALAAAYAKAQTH